jgi:outer membrane protein OmpA-like peptidoglycan-associated protein
MNANLMDAVKGMLTPETVAKAAEHAGESTEGMHRAMSGAVPTILAGFTQSAAMPGGVSKIFGVLTGGSGSVEGLMGTIFGGRAGAVGDALAQSSGVQKGGASHALSLALPMVVGALGKHVLTNGLNAEGVSQLLFSHKQAIVDDPHTPPGLAGALGLGSLSALGGAAAGVAPSKVATAAAPVRTLSEPARAAGPLAERAGGVAQTFKNAPRWMLILPALVAAGLLVWGISSLRGNEARGIGVTAPQAPAVPTLSAPEVPALPKVEAPAAVPAPAAGPLTLPGGKTLDFAASSAEAAMAHALADRTAPLPETFDFENLSFDNASSAITLDSAKTIEDLAAMLQAYPSARVRIEGHADSTGSPATNQALSEARATSLKNALVAKGIAGERIETRGEAARRPVPGAAPAEARNRRAEVVLLER